MAKRRLPRRAMADGLIAGYSLSTFTKEAWTTLENTIGKLLDDDAHAQIIEAAKQYSELTLLWRNNGRQLDLLGRRGKDNKEHAPTILTEFISSLQAAVKAWIIIQAEPTHPFVQERLEEAKDSKKEGALRETAQNFLMCFNSNARYVSSLERTMTDLEGVLTSWSIYKGKAKNSGRKVPDPFISYVNELAKIVIKAGGKISSRGMDSKDEKYKPSPFVKFVMLLDKNLPENVREDNRTESAWNIAISRALKLRQERRRNK